MKKKHIITISIIIIIMIIFIPIIVNKKNNNENNGESEYTITSYDGNFKINKKDCANLKKDIVQKIEDKLFCVNHNAINIFKDTKELTTKDYQMTVWFSKLKLDKAKKCTSKEFEQIIKDTYNVDFKEHQSLENTLEYSKRIIQINRLQL